MLETALYPRAPIVIHLGSAQKGGFILWTQACSFVPQPEFWQ